MNTPAVTNLLGVRVREKHDVGPGREGVIMAVRSRCACAFALA